MVHFEEDEKIKIKNLESFFTKIHNSGINDGILVYKKEISSSAKQSLDEFVEYKIELFQEKELLVNITEHEYVPKHYPINEKEKKEHLEK